MIFFISYQTFAQKKENLSIRFDMVAMLRLVLSMFFFIPDNDTLIFGVPNSYFPFSIGFFSFFRFCDAPCEKEETAFICASNGSLYRFYCSQRLRDFQNIF